MLSHLVLAEEIATIRAEVERLTAELDRFRDGTHDDLGKDAYHIVCIEGIEDREAEVARLTALVTYEQERNANNVAMADIAIKETCERAFNAGMARAIGSHEDFQQTHPTFEEWWKGGEK